MHEKLKANSKLQYIFMHLDENMMLVK